MRRAYLSIAVLLQARGCTRLLFSLAFRGILPRLTDQHLRNVLEERSRDKERHPDTA
jgi:hypothetical protein